MTCSVFKLLLCDSTMDIYRHSKFQNATGVPCIPEFWLLKGPYRVLEHKGQTKKSLPQLREKAITDAAKDLHSMVESQKCFRSKSWKRVKELTDSLITSLISYGEHLALHKESVAANHEREGDSQMAGALLNIIDASKSRTSFQKSVCLHSHRILIVF